MSIFSDLKHIPNMFGVISPGRRLPEDASDKLKAFADKHDNGEGPMNRKADGRFGWGEVRKTHDWGCEFVNDLETLETSERIWVEKGISGGAAMLQGFGNYTWKRFVNGG